MRQNFHTLAPKHQQQILSQQFHIMNTSVEAEDQVTLIQPTLSKLVKTTSEAGSASSQLLWPRTDELRARGVRGVGGRRPRG